MTQTKTVDGETVVVTYTETEYIKTHVPVTHYATVEGPDVTKTADHQVTIVVTKAQDVTVTKTIPGEVVYETETCTEYATQDNVVTVTEHGEPVHKTTKVYTTVHVTEGSTVTVTKPGEVIYETVHKTVTETVHGEPTTTTVVQPPVTETTEVIETETTTFVPPPATTEPVEAPTSEPEPVPTAAAQANRAPLMAIAVGVAGAVALL